MAFFTINSQKIGCAGSLNVEKRRTQNESAVIEFD